MRCAYSFKPSHLPTLETDVTVFVTVIVLEGSVVTIVEGIVDVKTLTELTVTVFTGRKQLQPSETALYASDSSGFGASGYLRARESGSFTVVVVMAGFVMVDAFVVMAFAV